MNDLLKTMPLPKDKEGWREWLNGGTPTPQPVVPLATDAQLDAELFDTEDAK